jgi:hypothetical protein
MRTRRRAATLGAALALTGAASLMLELLALPGMARVPHIGLIAAGLSLLFITGIAFDRGLVNSVLAVGGVVVLLVRYGAKGAVAFIILLALMGWILGLLLGWRRR